MAAAAPALADCTGVGMSSPKRCTIPLGEDILSLVRMDTLSCEQHPSTE